jgi:Flp/Fap pilin component
LGLHLWTSQSSPRSPLSPEQPYGLIAAGIALAIIAVVNGLGTTLNDKFSSINSSLK